MWVTIKFQLELMNFVLEHKRLGELSCMLGNTGWIRGKFSDGLSLFVFLIFAGLAFMFM